MRAIITTRLTITLAFLLFLLPCHADSRESNLSPVTMYANTMFTGQQTAFLAMDRIYGVLSLRIEKPGEHILVTDWYTPFNSVEHQTVYRFTSTEADQQFQLYSWLKLWKKGPFARTLTGQYFKQEFYGQWTVRFYLDGRLAGEKKFEVH